MGMIADFLARSGRGQKPRTIGEVEGALARLRADREGLRAELAEAQVKRDEMLLEDGTDEQIAALDLKADRARLKLERIARAEPLLVDELTARRGEAKAALWRELNGRYLDLAAAYVAALRGALEARGPMLAAWEDMAKAGFAAEAQTAIVKPPFVADAAMIARVEAEIETKRARLASPAAPGGSTRAASPHSAPAPIDPQPGLAPAADAPQGKPGRKSAEPQPTAVKPPTVAAEIKHEPPPAPKPPRPTTRKFVPVPDADGNLRLIVLKPGISIGDARPKVGEEITLPAPDAIKLVERTVAEFADYFSKAPQAESEASS
jgi:hypothetical protein